MHWVKIYEASGYAVYFNLDGATRLDSLQISGSSDWAIFATYPATGSVQLEGTYASQADCDAALSRLVAEA